MAPRTLVLTILLCCLGLVNRDSSIPGGPEETSAKENEAVNLQCFCPTSDQSCWCEELEENGEPVLQNNSCSSDTRTDGVRRSGSSECCSPGNCSLAVEEAQLEDGGDCFCYVCPN